jgi:hypothetical protein
MNDFTNEVRTALTELGFFDKNGRRIPGPQGVRGPAGPIEAAVINATEAATNAARKAVIYPFEEKIKQLRSEFQDLKDGFRTFIDQALEAAVAHNVITVLQEYGVLDDKMNPLNVAHLESHLKKIGVIEKS